MAFIRDRGSRSAKARAARQLSFYDGRICLGSITIDAKGKCSAFDDKGRRLGSFRSQRRAIEAIYRAQVILIETGGARRG